MNKLYIIVSTMKKIKIMHICFTIVLGFVLMGTSCKKEKPEPNPPSEPQLPAITTSGKNTFGCYINNELYIPKGGINYRAIEYPRYYSEDGYIDIKVLNQKDFEGWIYIYILTDGIFGVGDYSINPNALNTPTSCLERRVDTIISGNETYTTPRYYVDTTKTNLIKITRLDLTTGIVSGEFEFTATNGYYNDTIKVTQGRFDLNNLVVQ